MSKWGQTSPQANQQESEATSRTRAPSGALVENFKIIHNLWLKVFNPKSLALYYANKKIKVTCSVGFTTEICFVCNTQIYKQ